MKYVDIDELNIFIFEVCQGFLNYCTKISIEYDIDAPDLDALKLSYLLEIKRNFTCDELEKIIQLMSNSYTVERFSSIYSSDDFLAVLLQTFELIENYSEISDKEIKRNYQEILHKYAQMNVDILYSKNIHNRIRGMRGAHKRYSKNLYKKQKFIFEFMQQRAKEQGKWKNLNAAVEDVLPALDIALKQFDKDWISARLIEKLKEREKLEQEFQEYKLNPTCYEAGLAQTITATRYETYINKIREITVECRELEKALKLDDPSLVLKTKLPFNTAYQPEVIKNLLRRNKELLGNILLD